MLIKYIVKKYQHGSIHSVTMARSGSFQGGKQIGGDDWFKTCCQDLHEVWGEWINFASEFRTTSISVQVRTYGYNEPEWEDIKRCPFCGVEFTYECVEEYRQVTKTIMIPAREQTTDKWVEVKPGF